VTDTHDTHSGSGSLIWPMSTHRGSYKEPCVCLLIYVRTSCN